MMATVEEHLVRIQEKERLAKEQLEQLKSERLASYPKVADNLNTRLRVLDTLGVVPIISTFTRKPLDPIRIPGIPTPELESTKVLRSQESPPSYRGRHDYLLNGPLDEAAKARFWEATALRPKLGEDLVWDDNLRIQLYKRSFTSRYESEITEWVNIIYYPHNILEIIAHKGRIYAQVLQPISPDYLVLSETVLDRISEAIAQGVNDPIKPEPRSYDHHFSPLIRGELYQE